MKHGIPIGIYIVGDSWLHRLPTGRKLLWLAVIGIGVVTFRGPWPPVVALCGSMLLARYAGVPARTLSSSLRPLVMVLMVLAGFQTWYRGWPVAVELVATTLTLVVLATTFTATTPTDELLDVVTRGARLVQPLGVDPERVALTFSLAIGAIPATLTIFAETRAAAKARGLERSPRATLTPFAIRAVASAHSMGEALAARGIAE